MYVHLKVATAATLLLRIKSRLENTDMKVTHAHVQSGHTSIWQHDSKGVENTRLNCYSQGTD